MNDRIDEVLFDIFGEYESTLKRKHVYHQALTLAVMKGNFGGNAFDWSIESFEFWVDIVYDR